MEEKEMFQIADFIKTILADPENQSKISNVKHGVLGRCNT
jgi:glycine/serine hydroxymethyltransferase